MDKIACKTVAVILDRIWIKNCDFRWTHRDLFAFMDSAIFCEKITAYETYRKNRIFACSCIKPDNL